MTPDKRILALGAAGALFFAVLVTLFTRGRPNYSRTPEFARTWVDTAQVKATLICGKGAVNECDVIPADARPVFTLACAPDGRCWVAR